MLFLGIEVDEQVVDLVQYFLGTGIGAVNLVDHHNRRQVGFQRLAQHVTRLRQRAFAGVHQQHDAIHHLQGAFHFAAEVAVAGGVHNIDFYVVIEDGGVLGENRDAAFTLQIVGVHDAVDQVLVGAKRAALPQHGVYQRGLAVVNVRDDRDITNV